MKSMKTTVAALVLSILIMTLVSCKKESTTQPKTTREKLLGKWNWISEVTNNYYGGMSHITTYNFPAGDYMEFKSDGKVTEYQSGSVLTYDYGVIDESKIWLLAAYNIYDVKLITGSDLQLYKKDVSGADYYESTLNLKR
jgi:uncharacterized membrane protein YkvI